MARECADGHVRAMIHRGFSRQQSVPTLRIRAIEYRSHRLRGQTSSLR